MLLTLSYFSSAHSSSLFSLAFLFHDSFFTSPFSSFSSSFCCPLFFFLFLLVLVLFFFYFCCVSTFFFFSNFFLFFLLTFLVLKILPPFLFSSSFLFRHRLIFLPLINECPANLHRRRVFFCANKSSLPGKTKHKCGPPLKLLQSAIHFSTCFQSEKNVKFYCSSSSSNTPGYSTHIHTQHVFLLFLEIYCDPS